jgi:putative ABC transport system permease protein
MFWNHLRHAWRGLRKSPLFATIAVVTLALGIGANTAIFSVIEAVLLHSLPFHEADRACLVERSFPRQSSFWVGFTSGAQTVPFMSLPDIEDIEDQTQGLASMAAANYFNSKILTGAREPRRVMVARVTPDFLDVLGLPPIVGRGFTADEARRHVPAVILTHHFWLSQYGANPGMVGQAIQLDHQSYRVDGILPAHLMVMPGADVLIPSLIRDFPLQGQRELHGVFLFARLNPGVSNQEFRSKLGVVAARLRSLYREDQGQDLVPVSLRSRIIGAVRPALLLLMGAVSLLLLIACANVSNMLLVKAAGRQRELAVRAALGASRRQIVEQLFAEALVLGSLAGAAGILLANAILSALIRLAPAELPATAPIGLNLPVLIFSAGLALLSAAIAATIPGLHVSLDRLARKLNERAGSASPETVRARSTMTVAEIALAVILMVGAAMLVKSFYGEYRQNAGFDTRAVLTFGLSFDPQQRNLARTLADMENVRTQLRSLPGIRKVGMTSDLPLEGGNGDMFFLIAGRPVPTSPNNSPDAYFHIITPGLISALGLRLAAGREFTASDAASSQPVAIINEALARKYFPGQNPLGQHIQLGSPLLPLLKDIGWREIVGVVADARFISLTQADEAAIFTPYTQTPPGIAQFFIGGTNVVVGASTDPGALKPEVLEALHRAQPGTAVTDVRTIRQLMNADLGSQRFTMLLLAAFAAVGVLLAALGIYGVIAFSVAQRRPELGVRMAFGAQPRDIVGLVVGGGLKLVLAGLAVGLFGAVLLGHALRGAVTGIQAFDPAVFLGVLGIFLIVAVAANVIPGLQALAVDPVDVLRSE